MLAVAGRLLSLRLLFVVWSVVADWSVVVVVLDWLFISDLLELELLLGGVAWSGAVELGELVLGEVELGAVELGA